MKEYIKIIGPYNSGTNLLIKLLTKNVIKDSGGNITEINILNNNDMKLWKHSNNYKTITEYLDKYKNIKIIFVYKNFLSLINSMKKESYNFKYSNIYKNTIVFTGNKLLITDNFIKYKYNSILDYYNCYYETYHKILTDIQYQSRAIFVDYKQLISKYNTYNYLKDKLSLFNYNIKFPLSIITILSKPSKPDKSCVQNSDEAFENYRKNKKKIYKEIMNNNKNIIKNINLSLLKYYENKDKIYDF